MVRLQSIPLRNKCYRYSRANTARQYQYLLYCTFRSQMARLMSMVVFTTVESRSASALTHLLQLQQTFGVGIHKKDLLINVKILYWTLKHES
jgi:hypothetical protein